MTIKQAIELFEKAHTVQEQDEMKNDINTIICILGQYPFDSNQARALIEKINQEHPENILLHNFIFQLQGLQGPGIPLQDASPDVLISDLQWKYSFLQAKKTGKLFDAFQKELRQCR